MLFKLNSNAFQHFKLNSHISKSISTSSAVFESNLSLLRKRTGLTFTLCKKLEAKDNGLGRSSIWLNENLNQNGLEKSQKIKVSEIGCIANNEKFKSRTPRLTKEYAAFPQVERSITNLMQKHVSKQSSIPKNNEQISEAIVYSGEKMPITRACFIKNHCDYKSISLVGYAPANAFIQKRNFSTTSLFNSKSSLTNHPPTSQATQDHTMNDSTIQDDNLKMFDPIEDKDIIDILKLEDSAFIDGANQVINYVNPSALEIGLSQYFPPRIFYDILMKVHEQFNLSWVATIAICCLVFRALTFKLYVNSKVETTNLINNQYKMQKSMIEFSKDPKAYQQAINDLGAYNSSLPKAMGSLIVNTILFSSFYFALRAMAYHPIESLKNESFAWLPSLTQQDPLFLFPILIGSSMFLMLRFNMENVPQSSQSKGYKMFVYCFPAIITAVTSFFPANLTVYWLINNCFTVSSFFLLKQPKIKEYFKIPEVMQPPVTGEQSKEFYSSFKDRFDNLNQLMDTFERNEIQNKIKKKEEMQLKQRIEALERKLAEQEKKNRG